MQWFEEFILRLSNKKCLFVEDSKMCFSANIILEDESKYVKFSVANSH